MKENGLIRKPRLILKLVTSQTGKQITKIDILFNISRSKGHQTMKFGQLIEYNMRNVFLEKSYTKCDGKASRTPSLDQQSEMLQSLFLLYFQVEVCKNILTFKC